MDAPVPARTRRLLTAWLGYALSSLVVAGLFAILVAFARTPAVRLLGTSADLFQSALVSHVTFALTVWFVAFGGVLWVYAAWRAGYRLSPSLSWTGFAGAGAGSALMALVAFTGSGTPYLNDYIPIIDHPLFWAGLLSTFGGVTLQALAYLDAWRKGRGGFEPPEALAAAVAALAMVLSVVTLALTWLRLDTAQPPALQLKALFWGAGHLFQFMHTAGMAGVWLIAAAVVAGAPLRRLPVRGLFAVFVPFMVLTVAAYAVWPPEALLTNRVVTWITFAGLGGPTLPFALFTAAALLRRRPLPWGSPLFAGAVLCLALFAVGGMMGVAGFGQDTRVPAHYHGMVGAVTIAYMGLVPGLLELTGRRPWSARLTRWQPYLYGLGLIGIMIGLHWAGGRGAPRKSLGFDWADAQALVAMNLMGVGSLLAIAGGLAFVTNIGVPLLRGAVRLPTASAALVGALATVPSTPSAWQAFAFDEGSGGRVSGAVMSGRR